MLRLSKHFVKNYRERVGNDPSAPQVNKLIRQAVRVQKGRRITGRFSIHKTLTIYWHVEKEIIITVDHFNRTVVSVYSRLNMPREFRIGENTGGYGHGENGI